MDAISARAIAELARLVPTMSDESLATLLVQFDFPSASRDLLEAERTRRNTLDTTEGKRIV